MQRKLVVRTACLFFVGAWLLLGASSSGHLFVADELCYYYMATSFVDHGNFDVPSSQADPKVRQALLGRDGRYYSPYSFGHSLYLAPWVSIAHLARRLFDAPWAPVFAFSFVHSLTTSLTWTLFFLVLLEYGLSVRRALVFASISLVSTLAFPYARSLFSEPVLALSLVFAWLCLLQRGKHRLWFSIVGGLSLAFAITVRPTAAVLLPAFWLLAWPSADRSAGEVNAPGWKRYWAIGLVAAISLTGVIWLGLFNYQRFGSWLASSYPPLPTGERPGFTGPLWFGLAVFLLSPGKAIWLFNPLLVLSAVGWAPLWKENRVTALFTASVFVINLGLHSVWCMPEGGTCWGPRFFVGVLPVLLLPGALLWARNRSRNIKLGFLALAALGLAVQFIGTSVNYSAIIVVESIVPKWASKGVYYSKPDKYNFAFSPFRAHTDELIHVFKQGNLLALRPEPIRVHSARSKTHSFPFWSDTLDVWAVHLVKDGYPAAWVLTVEAALVLAGVALVLLAFRTAATARTLVAEAVKER